MCSSDLQYERLRHEILAAVTRVCDSQHYINGPEVETLERELSIQLGVDHALAVSSGTDALLLALMTLGVGPGDEVVTTAYSFFATAGAISRVGARPVFVDIDPETLNISAEAAVAAVTPRTKAIIPVHLFGLSADLDPIVDAYSEKQIPVIEDAAQAIGATYNGKPIGGIGTFGCFSFFPSKNLGAFGDAGLLTSNDPVLMARARLLRTHGMQPKYHHALIGGNFRCDAMQAAILRIKAPHLPSWTEARRRNAERYRTLFADAGLTGLVQLPTEPRGRHHIYNQFVIRVPDRDRLKRHLDQRGIGNEVYYPVPFHLQQCFASLGHRLGDFPESERAAQETLAIPIFGELTPEQQGHVVETIGDFLLGSR